MAAMTANIYPFLLFLLFILLCICTFILFVYGVFITIGLITRIYEKVMSKKLEKMVRRNPDIGQKDKDGNFVFEYGRFGIIYKIIDSSGGTERKEIKPILIQRRLTDQERKIKSFKSGVRQFWSSDRWVDIFEPRALLPLLTIIFVLYCITLESEHSRDQLTRWVISHLLRIDEKNVIVKPDGLITISAKRMNAVDGSITPVSFDFNPGNLTSSKRNGYVILDSSAPESRYGYGKYPVELDDSGNISVNRSGRWITGKYTEDEIMWDEPQPTIVQGRYIHGHDLVHLKNGEILIKDK